jgi:hypothetical protein
VSILWCPCPGLIGFGKRTEGFGDGRIIGNKLTTVVGHTQETSSFISGCRGIGIVDGRDFLGIWGEIISEEYLPKELNARFVELALFGIQGKMLRGKRSKCVAWSVTKMMMSSLTLRAPSIPLGICWICVENVVI